MDPFVAEIRIFPFNFAPKGWAWCNGQLLPLSQNTALFSLLGTTYGGDGKSTFALPDMQGNAPVHTGANQPGPGLSFYSLGETGGSETVTLLQSEIPNHSHFMRDHDLDLGELNAPSTNRSLAQSANSTVYAPAANFVQMNFQSLSPAGGDLPHNNMQPYLTFYYNIALQGVFPARP
jgi:microcystin-dependent protein